MSHVLSIAVLLAVQFTTEEQLDVGTLVILSPALAWSLVAGTWLLLMAYCVLVGRAQKKDAQGTLSRLLWVSTYLGLIGALPVFVVALFASSGPVLADQCRIAAGCTFLVLVCLPASLLPPVVLRGTKEKFPLVTEDRFLRRVQELAEKMSIPVPLVRLWPSITTSQQALAFVGTLQAPQLVITDGILNRLTSEEGDAILAHELAHIANSSLFVFAAVIPTGFAVTTAAAAWLPLSIALPFGFAFLVGLRRLVSRPFEFDCDFRAARATNFRVTSSALAKVHAAHFISSTGILSLLVFATATHPHRDARLAALFDSAPSDDRPDTVPDAARVWWHRRVAECAGLIWFTVIGGSLVLLAVGRSDWMSATPLWIVGLTPLILMWLSIRRQIQIVDQRSGTRWKWLRLFALGIIIGISSVVLIVLALVATALILHVLVEEESPDEALIHALVFGFLMLAIMSSAVYGWSALTRKRRKLQHEVTIAMQLHDFRRVVDLCMAQPETVQRNPKLRYLQALAEAICGNREAAIESLEQLWKDKPHFPLTALALGELLLDENRAERAVEVARSVSLLFPRDAAVPLLEARAFRRLGRIDEAQSACDRGLSYEPQNGCLLALAAAIELDRGNRDRAKELIIKGLDLAPGDPYALVVRAEIALQLDHHDQANLAVQEAINAVQSSRLTLLRHEIARLKAAIGSA